MAKVKGPLFSIEARGKIADAMVFFPWKGRNAVRKWLKPANPRDVNQQIIRQKLASCGKNTKIIAPPSAVLANGAAMYKMIKDLTPADNIWNAYFPKTIMNHVKTDSNFTALSSALYATISNTYWKCCAAALGFEALTGPEYATTIQPELQLFMGAWGAYDLGLCDATHSYSTYPSNWLSNVVSQFATNYTKAY